MEKMLTIRTLAPHEGQTYRHVRLRSLADSPDAFCSTLAEEQDRAADAWTARLSAAAVSGQDRPLIAQLDDAAVGLLWAKVDAADSSIVNIFQVWVAPEARGRGAAAALLEEAISWARSRHARVVQLSVTCGDTSARRLYVRAGFQDAGSPVPRRPGAPLLEQEMQLSLATQER